MSEDFDESLLQLDGEGWEPFYVKGRGEELSHACLPDDTELLVFEILDEKHALLTSQMAYYHVAQGSVQDVPFAVSFCCVCHSGAQLDPRVDGSILDFECAGLYHGTAILRDTQTGTLWHHMTGKAMHGSKTGTALAVKPLQVTTVSAALKDAPGMRLHRVSQQPANARALIVANVVERVSQLESSGWLPEVFIKTLPEEDSRLPRMTLGLGVRVHGEARFYEMAHLKGEPLQDTVGGSELTISIGPLDKVPFAVNDSGHRPLQYFLRWYGFALTFPECTIWEPA